MDFKLKLARYEADYNALNQQFIAMKEKFNSSHQTLSKIIQHMNEGLMLVSKMGFITLFNPAAGELLESSSDLLNELYAAHFSDALFGFSMKEALGKTAFNRRIFLSLNHEKEIEVSTSMIPDIGLLLLISARVDQKQLDQSLNQAERLKELGEMAATLAHEIRNPLGGIEGFAQLLRRDLKEREQQSMVEAILEGTKGLNKLVTDVLDYAKPLSLHFAPVNLVTLIESVLELIQVKRDMPTCHFKTTSATVMRSVDSGHLKHVLLNLLQNAKEAGATSIEIELNASCLKLTDNGEGISQKNLKKIFTPFFTTKTRGTGLGLSHSLAIIKGHGGTLEMTSEVGKGTQIIIKLIGKTCGSKKSWSSMTKS